jgi:predicted alpha-1,2-mannosidase
MTHNKFYENIFSRQLYNYKDVFNPATNFVQGKDKNGNWNKNFNPYEWGGPFVEGNSWHYTWSVFHDIQGLINLMGGDKHFVAKLDSVFSAPDSVDVGTYGYSIHEMNEMVASKMGQYAQGNEPIEHMPYLYDYAGQPWKTQFHIRQIMDKLYNASENGYPGDEDEGQMSSWYVLSAMGLYSVCPGTDQYVIGSPVFNKITITLENGNKFVISAPNNNRQNVYIQGATLNGKDFTHNWIKYADIINGGELEFEMGNSPNKNRSVNKADRPYSLSNENL